MTSQHPITPPPELKQQWREQAPRYRDGGVGREHWLMDRAAQWGADEELEACRMEIIDGAGFFLIDETSDRVELADDLRNARRPEPSKQAEKALNHFGLFSATFEVSGGDSDLIRRALERLKQLEDSND